MSCSQISNTKLERPYLSNLIPRVFEHLGRGGGWVGMKGWSAIGVKIIHCSDISMEKHVLHR